MAEPERTPWVVALDALVPRRAIARGLTITLGWLGSRTARSAENVAAKKKHKKHNKPCKPKCTGKTCGDDGCKGHCPPGCAAGFTCVRGACKCKAGVTCDGVCCGASQVCDGADQCCHPQATQAVCEGKCGDVPNNCDQAVDCSACPPHTCRTGTCTDQHVCDYALSPDDQPGPACSGDGRFCCQGECCTSTQVCTATGCCTPDEDACAASCGMVANACGQQVDCGACPDKTCQQPTCTDQHTCANTPIADGSQGPNCHGEGESCCKGSVCCTSDQICTGEGCCTPNANVCQGKCGLLQDNCGRQVHCGGCSNGFTCDHNLCVCASEVICGESCCAQGEVCDGNACSPPYAFVTKWGTNGTGNSQFRNLAGIAVDDNGNVFVADFGNDRIQKFDNSGGYVTQWDSAGSIPGSLNRPDSLATDATGDVYVVEYGASRLQKFTNTGTFLAFWGANGTNNGSFQSFQGPVGVGVDDASNVFVIENSVARIQTYSAAGALLGGWSSPASGDGQFANATDVVVDSDGHVFTFGGTDAHRVVKFASDGTFLAAWGPKGSGDGEFESPVAGAVDADGNLYVVDNVQHRVQMFTNDGVFLAKFGSFGTGNGQFDRPLSVAVDSAGNVFVGDFGNNRIQKFAPVMGAPGARGGADGPRDPRRERVGDARAHAPSPRQQQTRQGTAPADDRDTEPEPERRDTTHEQADSR